MSPFDYIRWESPPSSAAVVALATFFVDQPEFVRLLKSDPDMLEDVLQAKAANAERCGFELCRAQDLARVIRTEQSALDALRYLESLGIESTQHRAAQLR